MLIILAVFAGSHSGLAYLRPYGRLLLHQDPGIPAVVVITLCQYGCRLHCTQSMHAECTMVAGVIKLSLLLLTL